jgi:hypothetical protein
MCWYVFTLVKCWLKQLLDKENTVPVILKSEKNCFGMHHLACYQYRFRCRTYSVILDTRQTDFNRFALSVQKQTVPVVRNCLIDCTEGMHVEKFNSFLGPCSDFHTGQEGVHVPYNLHFFFNHRQGKSPQCRALNNRVFEVNTNMKTYDFLKKVWKPDCTKTD